MLAFYRRTLLTGSILCALLSLAVPAGAQTAHFRVIEENGSELVLEAEALWPRSLRASLDSIGAGALSQEVLMALSGGMITAHRTLQLPSTRPPRVRVLASEYDEVALPLAAASDSLVQVLAGAQVEVVGIGEERKRLVGTLVARLLSYDPSTSTLRRYRKVRVAVELGANISNLNSGLRMGRLAASSNPHVAVTRSVLADGAVFKIAIREEGVYRLDRAYLEPLLAQAGLTLGNVVPAAVRMFGNGGAPLPALNSDPRPADLVEVPVSVRISGSGISEIVFYARAASGWNYDATRGEWVHYVNPFSNDNYYFLKIEVDAEGKRVQETAFPGYPDAQAFTAVTGRAFSDLDEVLWSKEDESGHTWVSRQISAANTLPLFNASSAPGLAGGTVQYRARIAVRSNPAARAVFQQGSAVLTRVNVSAVSTASYDPVARVVETTFTGAAQEGQGIGVGMRVEATGSGPLDPQAAVDWIRAFYPQALSAQNGYLRFATPAGESGRLAFVMSGFQSQPLVWDVSDPAGAVQLGVRQEGSGYVVQLDVADPLKPKEIVAFTDAGIRPAPAGRRIANQNLHGIQGFPDYAMVTPDTFRVFADELAEHRRQDGLEVEVVTIDQIYNEFSGGLPDMRAVRDYFKFLYDRAPDEARLLRYGLLFGDGHYDFRGLEPGESLENWIFAYETEESFDGDESFTSDDYFGLLDDSEGIWSYSAPAIVSRERVDIGIGRLPVQSAADAENAVSKIKYYESTATFGAWRTNYAFVADDGLTGLAATEDDKDLHTQNADVVATTLKTSNPGINQRKIYAISYPRVYTGGEWRIPAVNKDLLGALEDGVLVFNYSGHGNTETLAQEKIFNRTDVPGLDNLDRMPVFITATCSFGRWDMAEKQSTAEDLFNHRNGGAIAMLTTVRTVFTYNDPFSLNVGLNRQLNLEMFTRDEEGRPRRLGDALRATKNTPVGLQGNNRKFNLLGDPAMRIGLPSGEVVVATVNGVQVQDTKGNLRALDLVTVSGEIRHASGTVDESFNGPVSVTVYDAERQVPLEERRYMDQSYYVVQEDLIWRGQVNAAGGRYQAEFVVPKDISYSNRPGRIAVYAQSGEGRQSYGYTDSVTVGGTAAQVPDDGKGPKMELFLNDTTFVSGGLTHARPELIVKLFDDSGINTVGAGVGHELLLVLDGDDARAVNLGSRYLSEGSYKRGRVVYPLEEYLRQSGQDQLSPGPHTLQVKAWDVLNNSATASLEFEVSGTQAIELDNVFNYPNPMVSDTRFVFEHNQPAGTPAEIQVRIYTLSGRPVRTIETEEALPGGVLPGGTVQIAWNGLDEDFDRLATGVYLYKVRVRVETPDGDRQVSEHIEKLAVIR